MNLMQATTRPRAPLSPHQDRPKPRLSSFDTVNRIYDNRSYTTQTHKLLDTMGKSSSRKPSPNKSRMISSSFVNPSALDNSSRDIPTPFLENLLTEGQALGSEAVFQQEISSNAMLPAVSRSNLSRGVHKRTASMLTPTDQTNRDPIPVNTRKAQKTPLSFLGDSPIDVFQDTLTQKPRKESPSIRTQLFQYSINSTKNARPNFTPNRKVPITIPSRCQPDKARNSGRSPIRSVWDGPRDDTPGLRLNNSLMVRGYEKPEKVTRRSPLASWQNGEDEDSEDDITANESFLPNMEDMLIIRHEIQGSQGSLLLTTSGDLDKEDVPSEFGSRRDLKNKKGSIKMRDLLESEKPGSNKYISPAKRTITPKNRSPPKREVSSFEAQMLAIETSYKKPKVGKQEEDRKNVRERSQEQDKRNNSRLRNVTDDRDNGLTIQSRQLSIKTNESDVENKPRKGTAESPLRVFRRTYQNGFSSATPKKPGDTSVERRKEAENRKPEHKRVVSIGGTNILNKRV